MTATRKYQPEELLTQLKRKLTGRASQIWLQVDNDMLPLSETDLPLAARIAASYHNQICYNAPPDDGWRAETDFMEARAEERISASLSEDSDPDRFE